MRHDLGTSAYRCFAQVVAKTPASEWTTSSNALFVVECEASENYVYFSMAYTGDDNLRAPCPPGTSITRSFRSSNMLVAPLD